MKTSGLAWLNCRFPITMVSKPIKILLIEDSPAEVRLLRESLKKAHSVYFDIVEADSLKQAEGIAGTQRFDVILLDLFLYDSKGLDTFRRIRSKFPETAIVILTIFDDEKTAIDAVRLGAQEYFVKGQIDVDKMLIASIRYAIERKAAENLKNEFLRIVSHEFRTSLSIIGEGINIMLDKVLGEINSEQRKALVIVRENIDRMVYFVNDLLDMSRIEAGGLELRRELISIKELIKEIVLLFESKIKNKGLKLDADIPEKDTKIFIDADKIRHVFINLLSNAIKFTEEGQIKITVEDKAQAVEFSVSDTGAGMPKDKLADIFNRYMQLSHVYESEQKGSGLGLYIVRYLVGMHEGEVWVESQKGKGSVFHFSLPKHSPFRIIEQQMDSVIRRGSGGKADLSVFLISITDYEDLASKLSSERLDAVLKKAEVVLKESLSEKECFILRDAGRFFVLNYSGKENTSKMLNDRLRPAMQNYLAENNLEDIIKLRFDLVTFPENGATPKDLMNKLKMSPLD